MKKIIVLAISATFLFSACSKCVKCVNLNDCHICTSTFFTTGSKTKCDITSDSDVQLFKDECTTSFNGIYSSYPANDSKKLCSNFKDERQDYEAIWKAIGYTCRTE